MIELLRSFSHWVEGYADSPWAIVILVLNSFTESIFNPIPPDPLLIGMSVINQKLALVYAALATISSVLGALVGHWLGWRFGRPLVLKFISAKKIDRVEAMFQKYGSWAILIAAFTPIPYKVFAVTAGVLEMDRRPFIVASIIGRGARFFLLGGLIFFFGEAMREFIETRFELLTLFFSILLIVSLVAIFFIMRWRRANGVPALVSEPPGETDLELG
ncbi:MAG TPA: YqaA family protein [Dehalococcoidia bacterium]|nr:YqaA family protein [Dehalococcoidia bacterium]